MPLTTAKKAEIIAKFQQHEGDTGSPEVQVALLSQRISDLTEHMKRHPKDFHSRRGLLQLASAVVSLAILKPRILSVIARSLTNSACAVSLLAIN